MMANERTQETAGCPFADYVEEQSGRRLPGAMVLHEQGIERKRIGFAAGHEEGRYPLCHCCTCRRTMG